MILSHAFLLDRKKGSNSIQYTNVEYPFLSSFMNALRIAAGGGLGSGYGNPIWMAGKEMGIRIF